jgi:hypothetical protein
MNAIDIFRTLQKWIQHYIQIIVIKPNLKIYHWNIIHIKFKFILISMEKMDIDKIKIILLRGHGIYSLV